MSFKRLDPDDFVVSAQSITATCWTGNVTALTTFFTQSNQVSSISGKYYMTVFNTSSAGDNREAQFQIAYGNENGGGALAYNNTAAPGVSPASTIYGQYRTLILEDENANFVWGNYSGSQTFYALSVERARYKESLLPGSINLTLSGSGTNNNLELTDNSKMVNLPTYYGTQRVYQMISGSNGLSYNTGSDGYTTSNGSYGWFCPDISTVLLNSSTLDLTTAQGISLNTTTTSNTNGNNNQKMFNVIVSGKQFALNSEETITSDFVFVRARNSEFNYSENPSYISGSTGEVIYNYFINNPQTYMTTIGLYNDSNDLLAVAKLSKPLNKDFTKEALVRVKLDF